MIACHVIAPPLTRLSAQSTCPFTQRTVGLIKSLRRAGFHVVQYANRGSEVWAHEAVELLGNEPFTEAAYFSWLDSVALFAPIFDVNVVMHAWGVYPGPAFMDKHRTSVHVDPGVGYDRAPWGPCRIYESEAWRHFMFGKYGSSVADRRYSWVIPWPFDPGDWPDWSAWPDRRDYVSFLGRLAPDKGLTTIRELARRLPSLPFKIAGPGDPGGDWPANVEFIGSVTGSDRASFLAGSLVHLCPTEYIEPFCGSAVEAMLCGTPVVASDYGGFTETVINGVTGYRASTLAEWLEGMQSASALNRVGVRSSAVERFSVEAAAPKYRRAIGRLVELYRDGWYTLPQAA